MRRPHGFRPTAGRAIPPRDRRVARAKRASLAATILLSCAVIALLGALPGAAAADSVIAQDTFSRSVTNGWGSADSGGAWTILDAASAWSVAPGAGSIAVPAGGEQRGVLRAVGVQDVDLLARAILPRCANSCDGYVLGRVSGGGSPTYYRVGAVQGTGRTDVYLRAQRSDGTYLHGDLDTGIPAATNLALWVRAEFLGVNPTTVRARVWADGTAEPSAWLLSTTDGNGAEQISGAVGVRARNEDTQAPHTFQFTGYTATALGGAGTPTPTPTVTNTPTSMSTGTPTATPTNSPTPTPTLGPGGTFAADSFGRTMASGGWGSSDSGGWWTVVGSPWNWSVAPGAGSVAVAAGAEERAYLSQQTVRDVDVTMQVSLPQSGQSDNEYAFVLARYAAAYSPTYYRVGVGQGRGGSVFIRAQRSDGSTITGDVQTAIAAGAGVAVLLHVEVQGANPTTIRARAWPAGGGEPSNWQLQTTDGSAAEQQAGMVGLRLRNEDTAAAHTFQIASYSARGAALAVSATPNPAGGATAHWLYVVVDGEVYVYDIDNGHALVKRFPIPEAGKRGLAVAPGQGLLYISECGTSNCGGAHGSLIAYDLERDVVRWIANYSFGVDQMALTPDGATIYMPHGADASDGTHSILRASDGAVIGSIVAGTDGHNTVVSLDGTKAYLGGYTGSNDNFLHVVSTSTNQVILNAGPTVNGVRPFAVNGKNTLAFTTSTNTCGFQVLSLTSGAVLYTVTFGGSCAWSASNAPSHGISLSPDEKQVWVMDAAQDAVEVYDVSGLPAAAPVFVASLALTSLAGTSSPCQTYCEREGWVLHSLSGRYVYVADAGDVFDTTTHAMVATLPALQNTRMLAEIDWTDGAPSATSTRFGLGRVTG